MKETRETTTQIHLVKMSKCWVVESLYVEVVLHGGVHTLGRRYDNGEMTKWRVGLTKVEAPP